MNDTVRIGIEPSGQSRYPKNKLIHKILGRKWISFELSCMYGKDIHTYKLAYTTLHFF